MYSESLDQLKNDKPFIEHSFVDWRDDHYFAFRLAQSVQSGNTPMITVEPRGDTDGNQLLIDINTGLYDSRIDALADVISQSKNPVYIRFGHEMELADLYPWGNQSPDLYVAAYRHFVNRLRDQGADNARFIWSPAGNQTAAEAYYPGDEYADVIGTTILFDKHWYGSEKPRFADLVTNRQWLTQFGKPVWIVEFGVGRADPALQKQLVDESLSTYRELGFSSLIYLNMVDANIVGPDYRLNNINWFDNFTTTMSANWELMPFYPEVR